VDEVQPLLDKDSKVKFSLKLVYEVLSPKGPVQKYDLF
jgi:hypothetical protein